MSAPRLSVIIPVYNEQETLPTLFVRLYPALDALGVSYEVLFVNDGSRDRSAALLKDQFLVRPDVTRVILFNANCGQHMAIMAGFEYCRGERVVTLDAICKIRRRKSASCWWRWIEATTMWVASGQNARTVCGDMLPRV